MDELSISSSSSSHSDDSLADDAPQDDSVNPDSYYMLGQNCVRLDDYQPGFYDNLPDDLVIPDDDEDLSSRSSADYVTTSYYISLLL